MAGLALLTLEILFCFVWLAEGKLKEGIVYSSTEVDGALESNVIVLGGLFPVHNVENNKCGSIRGIQPLEGMVLATQMVNDNPFILPGVTLAFEIRDTCAQANDALEQSLKYVSARSNPGSVNGTASLGISGVVGAGFSRVSTAVARLLRLFEVPQISYGSTANVLSDKTTFNYFFRTVPPDSLQAKALADIVDHFNWTYVIAVYTDDIYGSEGIRAFIDELNKKQDSSQNCIATSPLKLSAGAQTRDFDRAVEVMTQEWVRNATVVILFGQLHTATSLLRAVDRRMKADPEFASKNFTWIGSDGWGDRLPAELHISAQGSLSVIPRSMVSAEFDDYFQSLHPSNYTANPWFGEYWESVFNCSLKYQTRLNECDLSNQALSSGTGYRQSSFAAFSIDATYAFAHAIHNLQQDFCQGGPGLCHEIVDTRSLTGGVAIRGELLLEYLHNVSFSPGASAEIIDFDSNGDQRGGYLVKNLKQRSDGEFVYEVIGYWDEVPLNRNTPLEIFGDIQWRHGRSDVPDSICSHPCGVGEYPEPIINQADCCWTCKLCPGTNAVSTGLLCVECERGYTPNESKTECVLIQPTYLMWSHWWSIIILILTCTGIIATTAVAIVFVIYRKHQVIKASSRELSAVLLCGIMLCYLLPFFFIARPSPWLCGIRQFGIGFCFALCHSTLLIKTNRIHRIFNRPSGSIEAPPLISPMSQLFFTALLVTVQIIIAIVCFVYEKPSSTYAYTEYSTELKCKLSLPYVIGLSVSLGYNLLLILMALYFAFRTRKVPQNYNEAKFISFTAYALCILWLAFVLPAYIATSTARLDAIYQTGSLMLAIILNASITLGILFIPKIYFLFSKLQKDHYSQSETYTSNNKHKSSLDQRLATFQMSVLGCDTSKSETALPPAGDKGSGESGHSQAHAGTLLDSSTSGPEGHQAEGEVMLTCIDVSTQTH